jgi:hypothetical protein
MATQTLPEITCASCGRHFKSKPELIGKKVRCLCGQTLEVPKPPPPPAEEDPDEGLYDLLPVEGTSEEPVELPPLPPSPSAAAPASHAAPSSAAARPPHALGLPAGLGAYPGIPARRPAPPQDKGGELKKMLIPILALCVLAGLIMGARFIYVAAKAPGAPLPGDDGRVASITDEYGAYEAREWLKASDRRGIIGAFWTREKAIKMVDQWYSEGAKKVLAFGGVITSSLAIELPDAGPQRKAFIDYAERWRAEHHFDRPPIKDVHQKYIMIDFM